MSDRIYEITCLNCGKSAFTFPCTRRAEHAYECRHCRQATYVMVKSDLGVVVKSEKQVANAFTQFENSFDKTVELAELCEKGCSLQDIRIRRTGAHAQVWWQCKGGWWWRNRPLIVSAQVLAILSWIWSIYAAANGSEGASVVAILGGIFVIVPIIIWLIWVIWWSTSSKPRVDKKHHIAHSGEKNFNLLEFE